MATETEPFLPGFISGRVADTFVTSRDAADSIESIKVTQRNRVYQAIKAAGNYGRTDDELQVELGLEGSSERPRRTELWTMQAIQVAKDASGQTVKRPTRTNRQAVVWVAVDFGENRCIKSIGPMR